MTKTQQKLMNLFVSKIAKKFSLQGAGKELQMHQALSYRASKILIEKKLILPDENGLYFLNYKENQQELISFEYLRTSEFLKNPRHKKFKQFVTEFIDEVQENNYIFLLFGSAVEKETPRDYDIVLFFDSIEKAQQYENILINLAESYPSLNVHINVDSITDLNQMLTKRDEKNVANESLNKHLIFYGAEQFYKILKQVRSYA
ncbi:hypothetical protein HOK51_03135 [Candidatus Woesearchaeota archaeon]|nr:hypothetical protein [Candidatus Woesearchaeota archaeon]MBT7367952.1 hypothetical protein [Candidatus Woesearchaeota archaeon]